VSYYPSTPFVPQFFNDAGVPLSGGTLTAIVADTPSTATPMYIDNIGTSAGSVITLNARGEPQVSGNTVVIWLDSDVVYKFILKDASNVSKWTIDDISDSGAKLRSDLASSNTNLGVSLVYGAGRVVNSIAALKALSKLTNSRVFVTGYYAAGDGGGGAYWYDSTDTTTADNGGTIIVATDGGRWKLQLTAPVSIKQFGAKGDLSQDDQPFIQACVTWAAGKKIYAPVGQYRLSSGVTSTDPINIYGDGNGCGPGPAAISNSGCTQFLLYSSTAIAFTSTSNYPSNFRNFQINVAVANRPMTSGGGILVSGPVGSTNANTLVDGVGFSNVFLPIRYIRTSPPITRGCYFDSFILCGVYAETSAGIEGAIGEVVGNYFFGTSGSTTQLACIVSEVGYGHIHDNLILGANFGIEFAVKNFDAGALRIADNFIENQGANGIYVQSQDGSKASMLSIFNNEFSNVAFTTAWQSSITVADYTASADWISDIQIKHNVHRHSLTTNRKFIWIMSGQNVQIDGEQFDNLGAGATTIAIDMASLVGAALKAPSIVQNCQFLGTFSTKYNLTAVTQLIDNQGVAFADLPTVANGSQVYCTDGTFANPVAGAGTGCFAKRLNGVWRGD